MKKGGPGGSNRLEPKASVQLEGSVERITFRNKENGYTVIKVRIEGKRDLVPVVGTFVSISEGEVMKFTGIWQRHPRYGDQFHCERAEVTVPATARGIEKYLGSGMIKGLGPVMAKRLVARFGADTLSVIERDAGRLTEVEGIGEKRIEMIRNAWDEQKEVRDVMVFLQGSGVSPGYATKIYRQYGKDSIRVVTENPFRLADDVFGIGFVRADKIAEGLGIAKDSPARIAAGILYLLGRLTEDGNVYFPYNPLVDEAARMLDIDRSPVEVVISSMIEKNLVVLDTAPPVTVSNNEYPVYLPQMYDAEKSVAALLGALLSGSGQMMLDGIDDPVRGLEAELGLVLSDQQKGAFHSALRNRILIITGGPGTGKTTIIRVVLQAFRQLKKKVLLTAPTGRAAKRMAEATGRDAKTLHRLLEFMPATGAFSRNEGNPLDGDVIIIDETSMVDIHLMNALLKAVPSGATVIFVGDVDQLPSVGPGNVLKDMIDSGRFRTVRLTDIFRQSSQSMIIVNAHRIHKGEMPLSAKGRGPGKDFYFLDADDPEMVAETIVSLCRERIPGEFGYTRPADIQVLAPMHKGAAGVAQMNTLLQNALNPHGEALVRGSRSFRKNDKVMQIRNNYDKDVFNGDIGRIIAVDREPERVTVDYDGRAVVYEAADLDEIVLAYAISVHKSQGSEYPVVVMPLHTQHYLMLQRNLLYTAVTRGRRLVVLVGTRKALAIAVKNDRTEHRYTLLRERLMSAGSDRPNRLSGDALS